MTRFHFIPVPRSTGRRLFILFITGLSFVVIGSMGGCDIPKRPPLGPDDVADLATKNDSTSSTEPADDSAPLGEGEYEPPIGTFTEAWQVWDLYSISGQPVGYNHSSAEATEDGEVRFETDNHLYVNQGRSRTLQRMIQTSFETPQGQLLRFESELHVGPVVTRTTGVVKGDKLMIESVRGTVKKNGGAGLVQQRSRLGRDRTILAIQTDDREGRDSKTSFVDARAI